VSGFRRAILTLRWRQRAAVISSHLSLPPSSKRSFEVRQDLGEKANFSAERSMSLRRSMSGGSSPPPLVIQLGPRRALSAAEDAEYRTLFLSIDADGGGTIDPDEMLSAMHGAGRADVTAADVAALFAAIDEDGNGELDVDEFVEAMSRMEAPPSDDAANADSPSSQSSGSLGGALLSMFGKKNAAGQQPVDPVEAARIKALQAQVADTTRVLNEFYSVSGAGCGRRCCWLFVRSSSPPPPPPAAAVRRGTRRNPSHRKREIRLETTRVAWARVCVGVSRPSYPSYPSLLRRDGDLANAPVPLALGRRARDLPALGRARHALLSRVPRDPGE
jgi:hypothetical protein